MSNPMTYTLDDVNDDVGFPPGDQRLATIVSSCLACGENFYLALARCWRHLGDQAKSDHFDRLSVQYQRAIQVAQNSAPYLAPQPSGNLTIGGLPFAGGAVPPPAPNQLASMANTILTPTRIQQLTQMMQNGSQFGTSLQPQALQPPSWHSQWASAVQVPAPQGTVTGLAGPHARMQAAVAAARAQTQTARRPDPVSDPYLAANDFADELRAHLGLESVADLPVKAYMLWVGIRAAQKDGEPWDDMDARLHEVAGVAYVSPAERKALALRTVAGSLYMAEWATTLFGESAYWLYMIETHVSGAVVVSAQDVVELGLEARVKELLARARDSVIYTAHVDMASDRIVITDGKMRRYMDLPAREVDVSSALENASQSALHQLWKVAMPADDDAPG